MQDFTELFDAMRCLDQRFEGVRWLDRWVPPRLVILGSESAGKSSLLERLVLYGWGHTHNPTCEFSFATNPAIKKKNATGHIQALCILRRANLKSRKIQRKSKGEHKTRP